MATVLVGGVSQEGELLLKAYLDTFLPDTEIVTLKPVGIKGKVKNQGSRADTVMIILDEDLYNQCIGVADDVINSPKTHKYIDDTGLKQFLISKFGVLPCESINLCDSFQVVIDFNKNKLVELECELNKIKTQIKRYKDAINLLETQQNNLNI